MKHQVYLCVDLKTATNNTHFEPKETRTGLLSMIDIDHFEFMESVPNIERRNPKVWRGQYINVAKNSQGQYVVHLRRLSISEGLDPDVVGFSIAEELRSAKEALNL